MMMTIANVYDERRDKTSRGISQQCIQTRLIGTNERRQTETQL